MTVDELLTHITDRESLDENCVLALEAGLGDELPTDYRNFLKACNGGCLDRWASFEIGSRRSGLEFIHGVRAEGWVSLKAHRQIYHRWPFRLPPDLLPIMHNSLRDMICIGLLGAHWGQIFFWDDDLEGEDQFTVERSQNLTLLAPSFGDFIQMLTWDDSIPMLTWKSS